jgi:hypothetical protein
MTILSYPLRPTPDDGFVTETTESQVKSHVYLFSHHYLRHRPFASEADVTIDDVPAYYFMHQAEAEELISELVAEFHLSHDEDGEVARPLKDTSESV